MTTLTREQVEILCDNCKHAAKTLWGDSLMTRQIHERIDTLCDLALRALEQTNSEPQAHDTEQHAAKVVPDEEQSTGKNHADAPDITGTPASSEPMSKALDALLNYESPPTRSLIATKPDASLIAERPNSALGGDSRPLDGKPGYRHNVTFAERGDTPLVDEVEYHTIPRVTNQGCVSADFARDLERVARQNTEALAALYDFAKRRISTGFVPPQAKLADEALTAFRELEKHYGK